MNESTALSRRTVFAGAAATAALMAMRQSVAQTGLTGGNWLAMVKAHHAMVADTLEDLMASQGRAFVQRETARSRLHYQLTAHSVAEENVLYPALARMGLVGESDKLYMDQAHAKVMNAELEMLRVESANEAGWFSKAKALQAAVLKHALGDEEGNLYPKLQQAASPEVNAALTAAYQREFMSVR